MSKIKVQNGKTKQIVPARRDSTILIFEFWFLILAGMIETGCAFAEFCLAVT